MDTQYLKMKDIKQAGQLIAEGECVAFQTETVYGLGADATNTQAVKKIYAAKGRPSDNPLIVHVASIDQAKSIVRYLPDQAEALMQHFWPGPLTLILPVKEGLLADEVTAGLTTVGVRFPATEAGQQLIKSSKRPIAAPSANRSGKPSPTTADHVRQDLDGRIAAILDTGPAQVGLESTILDLTAEPLAVILRPGGLAREEIEAVIGPVALADSQLADDTAPKAPGMKYKHYSPDEDVYIVKKEEDWGKWIQHFKQKGKKVGLLASKELVSSYQDQVAAVFSLGDPADAQAASHHLFEGLRSFASTPAEIILAQSYPTKGIGAAYMNRLEKAAGFKYL